MVGTSAAFVAIVGGLLVARFVGIDIDQRTSRKVVADARDRLQAARDRATDALRKILDWDAEDFFASPAVLQIVERGMTAPAELVRANDWPHSEDDLQSYAAEVAGEFQAARNTLPGIVTDPGLEWDDFRRNRADLPETRWPRAWENVYELIREQLAAEARAQAEARRKAARARNPLFGFLDDPVRPSLLASQLAKMSFPARSDLRATAERRYDNLRAAHQIAEQQVQDYEGELRRLQAEHAEIVRPDARLWWGIVVVVGFAVVGSRCRCG
jgi:hypothetical protein